MKISLSSLTTILITHKQKYLVERSDKWDNKIVLKFSLVDAFLQHDPHIYISNSQGDQSVCGNDRREIYKNRVLLHYDMSTNSVLSICQTWYDFVKNAKSQAKERNNIQCPI